MPQKHWLTWFCQNTSVPEVNVWCAVRLLLSSHWGELSRIIVKVLCLLHTVLGVSNKLPHTAVKPDILYPVVIVRSDVLYVPQLSGVKQAAGWSVILVSIWNTKIRESLRLSWSPHTHLYCQELHTATVGAPQQQHHHCHITSNTICPFYLYSAISQQQSAKVLYIVNTQC